MTPIPYTLDAAGIMNIIPDAEPVWNNASAADYEADLTNWAKDNPYRIGSFIAAYEDSAHAVFIAYGLIEEARWSDLYGAYDYTIRVCNTKDRITAWGFHTREASPEEMRLLMRLVKR